MAGHNVAPAIFFMTQHQGSRGLYVTTSTGVPMGSRTFEIFALKSNQTAVFPECASVLSTALERTVSSRVI
jgi:hypothetical protein